MSGKTQIARKKLPIEMYGTDKRSSKENLKIDANLFNQHYQRSLKELWK